MKTKQRGLLTLLLALIVQLSFAQEKTVTGTVTDQDGQPLPGVNILVQGTTNGTQTDFDGNYSIDAEEGQTLVFTYIGQKEVSQAIGAANTINVQMEEDAQALDEVVVTALGISREKRSLGYSTQEVDGEDLNTVKSGNFVNSISGKASGIQVKRTNNLGGSTNVVIRGNASLTGSNQALFVVDGVPISNTNSNSEFQAEGSGNYYDYGNAASDINPEDIASVNVLKGAAASALYGSRAANGVIMITTKKGKKTQGLGVTISSSASMGFYDKSTFAEYQDQYGAGYGDYWTEEDIDGDGVDDQVSNYIDDASYGPAFDSNLLVYQWDSFDPESSNYLQRTPWVAAKRGPDTFFETPITLTNSISVSNAVEKGSYRLSYTRFDQTGLLPNSSIIKHNFSMSGTYDLSDKLKVTGFANYIHTAGLGRNSTGYSNNIMSNFRQWWETNVNVQDLRDIYFKTKRNVTWNPSTSNPGSVPAYWDNPYWQRYENYQNDSRNRFLGNVSLTYQFTDWLSIMGRVATDSYSEIQEERRANGSVPANFGVPDSGGTRGTVGSGYGRRNIQTTETNYDLTVNFDKDFGDKFNLKGILGTNINRREFQSIYSSTSGGLGVPKLYALQNSIGPLPLPVERDEKIGINGIFASASIGYDNLLFVDGSIRKDHSSTLPEDNSTFYYPSIATSFVFSNLIDSNVLSFGKIRLNYAEVGNSAPFDYLYDTYNVNIPPGSPSTSVDNTKNNAELKPERTKSIEAGLEMRFLTNRLGLDLSVYKNNSVDQIFGVPVSRATGFEEKILNAGEIENRGIEVSLNGSPIRTEDFGWDINVNWSKNDNKVLSLEEGIENLQLGSFQGGITINARVGEPYGILNGTDYTYLNGERVVNPDNGKYVKTGTSDQNIGDTNPDWLMGISNKFHYKNLSLSVLVDFQHGGSIFSLDQYYGLATGLYPESAFINDLGNPVRNPTEEGGGFIHPGVNPDGSVNTSRLQAYDFSGFGYQTEPDAAFVYDASYVKLREVALTYNLPKKIIDNLFFTDVSLGLVGSNVWIIHKNFPYADPESGLGAGNLQGFSSGPLPTTKDYSFNITLKF